MRFHGIALLAGAAILGACGGEKQPAADSSAAASNAATPAATPATTDSTSAAPTTGAAPATSAPAAAGAATAAAATGATKEVKMIGDATGYKFDPANITVKQGDAIKFIMVTGGPHNVTFQNVAAAAKAQLDANMPGAKLGELSGPMLMAPNEAYVVSFAKVPAGKYDYICTPHAAMNMKGSITVQ